MDCSVCKERYDAEGRRPKNLPCGDTICQSCVGTLRLNAVQAKEDVFPCPRCREETPLAPDEFPTSYSILDLLEKFTLLESCQMNKVKRWCVDCGKQADVTCHDQHTICPLRAERSRQMDGPKSVLAQAIKSRLALETKIKSNLDKITQALTSQLNAILAERNDAEEALQLLDSSLEVDSPEWDSIVQKIKCLETKCIKVCLPEGQKLNLKELSQAAGREEEKALMLVQNIPAVTEVDNLGCHVDPMFAKWMLYCHGPTLESLTFEYPSVEHLQAVTAMPNLKKLTVFWYKGELSALTSLTSGSMPALDKLILCDMDADIEERQALIQLFRGARLRLGTVWTLEWSADPLVKFLKDQSASPSFTIPREIVLYCILSPSSLEEVPSAEECTALCSAVRQGLDSVDVWCYRHKVLRGATDPGA